MFCITDFIITLFTGSSAEINAKKRKQTKTCDTRCSSSVARRFVLNVMDKHVMRCGYVYMIFILLLSYYGKLLFSVYLFNIE